MSAGSVGSDPEEGGVGGDGEKFVMFAVLDVSIPVVVCVALAVTLPEPEETAV